MNWSKIMIEKEIIKYVIGNTDTGDYLKAELRNKSYIFVEDIESCTKTYDSSTAEIVIRKYHEDTQHSDDLVPLPLKITYELLEGEEYEKATELDMMNIYCNMIASKGSSQEIELNNGLSGYINWD